MRITKTEEYGIRLVIRLAAEGTQMTVADLARGEALPEPTVGKLLNRLKCGGLVESVRGRGGGYELSRAADDVTVSDVLAALGQSALSGSACTDGEETAKGCPHLRRCNLRPVWTHLETLINQVFDRTTVADLLKAERRVRDHLHHVSELWPADGGEPRGREPGLERDDTEHGMTGTTGVRGR